jgi:hypothetical protein
MASVLGACPGRPEGRLHVVRTRQRGGAEKASYLPSLAPSHPARSASAALSWASLAPPAPRGPASAALPASSSVPLSQAHPTLGSAAVGPALGVVGAFARIARASCADIDRAGEGPFGGQQQAAGLKYWVGQTP